MNIVILGHVCIDKNTSENASYTAVGGPAMFMDKIFRQLPDCSSTIVAPYGKDFLPFVKETTLYPTQPTTEHSLVYENITKNRKRIQKCYNYQTTLHVPIDEALIKMLSQADLLYIAPLVPDFSPEYIQSALQYVKNDCYKVLLPQGYFRQFDDHNVVVFRPFIEAEAILPLVDAVVVSEQDYPEMKTVSEKWAREHDVIVAMTVDEKGVELFTHGQHECVSTVPVLPKDIVDSVGSGDIFSAGFGYWYKKTRDVVKAADFANKLARQCLFYTPEEIKIDYKALL